jgi:hypothetical protein
VEALQRLPPVRYQGVSQSVPKGRLRVAQDVSLGVHPTKTSPAGTTENAPGRYPDFLCSFMELRSFVRLSVKKAAYADLSRAACRKSGSVLGELGPHANADKRSTSPSHKEESFEKILTNPMPEDYSRLSIY